MQKSLRYRLKKAYCDSCNRYIGTPIVKQYYKNICPLCRQKVPDYIPYKQHGMWLRLKNERG